MNLNVSIEGRPHEDRPAVVLMHFLGGSGREWDEVVTLLDGAYQIVRIDMPGFGGSFHATGYTVQEMVDQVLGEIRSAGLRRYVLVGHSMSGKVAMVLARCAEDSGFDAAAGFGLAGLLMVAPSPPAPEPMSEEKRGGMIGLLGEHHADDFARARSYITKNEVRDIPDAIATRAVNEVLRMNRTAWVAWLTHGSKEDWAQRVGVLNVPALVVAGEKDLSLGPPQQRELTLRHLAQGSLKTVPGCSHLIPMECPSVMADALRSFAESLEPDSGRGGQIVAESPVVSAFISEEYLNFLASDRLSKPTYAVVSKRIGGPGDGSGVLSDKQIAALKALLARVVPQGDNPIDLTGFVLARLASGKGDGWRYANLPEDADAYRQGLDRLIDSGFLEMTPAAQDEALHALAASKGSVDARWFEEVRGDVVTAYVAHPATLARMGYSGFGVGGANTPHQGFVTLGPNQREDWEPVATGQSGR